MRVHHFLFFFQIPQKKIWDVGDEGKRPPEGKGMFPSPWTRDEPWSSNPGGIQFFCLSNLISYSIENRGSGSIETGLRIHASTQVENSHFFSRVVFITLL